MEDRRKRKGESNKNQGEGEGPRTGRETPNEPPQTLSEEELRKLLRKNRFCRGIRYGREYVCGGETDESARSEAIRLLDEAIARIRYWQIWDTWWIDRHKEEWLAIRRSIDERLRSKYGDDTVNGILSVIDNGFISYIDRFKEYWVRSGEIKEIIDSLVSGEAEVIIWENTSGLSVYGKNMLLSISETSESDTVIHLVLRGLEGITLEVPKIFDERFIRELFTPLKIGFAETDESVDKGKPVMSTSKPWQALLWSLMYYGRMHMRIHSINVNKYDITITWQLRSIDHESLKGFLNDTEKLDKLNRETLLAILFTAVLGDGSALITNTVASGRVYAKPMIELVISSKKYETWETFLNKLKSNGFLWYKDPRTDNSVNVVFAGSHAVDVARGIINILPPIMKDLLDALAIKTWINMKQIAEYELKFRKGMQIIFIADYAFSVNIREGTVEARHNAKDENEVKVIREKLRMFYGDEFANQINVYPEKGGKYLTIIVPMRLIERYYDIKVQTIRVLCKKLNNVVKDEKKKGTIIRHLIRLTTPTEGAAAAIEVTPAQDNAKITKTKLNINETTTI